MSWVLDADVRAFFDTLQHEWLVKFIEHRIADRRILRLICEVRPYLDNSNNLILSWSLLEIPERR